MRVAENRHEIDQLHNSSPETRSPEYVTGLPRVARAAGLRACVILGRNEKNHPPLPRLYLIMGQVVSGLGQVMLGCRVENHGPCPTGHACGSGRGEFGRVSCF
jgi:hypothetical protein